MFQKEIQEYKELKRNRLLTELALERTILAKQRTLLTEINVLLGVIGLSILLYKFFELNILRFIGLIASLFSIVIITELAYKYNKFKRKIKKIDKRNHFK